MSWTVIPSPARGVTVSQVAREALAAEGGGSRVAAPVLNPAPAVRLARRVDQAALILRLHGIPVDPDRLPLSVARPVRSGNGATGFTLRIHVADLRILRIEERERLAETSISAWKFQRMQETACRAVYLLGLHFGCVHLRVYPGGRWCVSAVDPTPSASGELAREYAAALRRLVRLSRPDEAGAPSTLGADPEFLLATAGKRLLYASKYVHHRGRVGYDRQSRANRGAVYPLAEIRPEPSPSPLALSTNIGNALAEACKVLPTRGVRWHAGSFPLGLLPTGGHIHISGVPLCTPLLRALDRYLCLPVMLLEERSRARRRRRRYGRLGDFRVKEHGGFEYRSLPSWLVSPAATRAVLCLAKTVADEWRRLPAAPVLPVRPAREFYSAKKGRFRRGFADLWQEIRNTPTAEQYAYELDYLEKAIASRAEWRDDVDIKSSWQL